MSHSSAGWRPSLRPSRPLQPDAMPGLQWFASSMHLPFDAIRSQYAEAVHAGVIANSILASRDFEKSVDALEHITLGPLARSV